VCSSAYRHSTKRREGVVTRCCMFWKCWVLPVKWARTPR
jgi:hypothetical protein